METELPRDLRDRIRRWYAEPDDRAEKDEGLERVFDRMMVERRPSEWADRHYEEIALMLGLSNARRDPLARGTVQLRRRMLARVAAVLLPLLIVGGAGVWMMTRPAADSVAQESSVTASAATEQITLADGSRITLRQGSTVSYNPAEESCRGIFLVGEADFSVEKTEGLTPFIVRTAHLAITVLGTEFTVRAMPGDSHSHVMLYTGSVKVDAAGGSTVLRPGQALAYSHADSTVEVVNMAVDDMLGRGFMPGLFLDNVPLSEIIRAVEANYGIRFIVPQGALLSGRYTLDVEGESMESVLAVLNKLGTGYTYELRGPDVIMKK